MFSTISKVVRNPLESFNHSQFKDPVTQYKLLGNHFTTINDLDVIKHCFIDNRDNYRFNVIRQKLLRSILGDGLITAEGEKWKHARHAMSPMFTPRNVKSFAQVMKTTIAREMDNLFLGNPESKAPEARSKLSAKFSALTYLVLSDTLFSGDIDREQSHVINDVATALLYVGRPDPLDLFQAPDWIPRLSRMKGLKAIKSLRLMIGKVLQKRKSEKQSGKDIPDDFLTRLLNVGDPLTIAAQRIKPLSRIRKSKIIFCPLSARDMKQPRGRSPGCFTYSPMTQIAAIVLRQKLTRLTWRASPLKNGSTICLLQWPVLKRQCGSSRPRHLSSAKPLTKIGLKLSPFLQRGYYSSIRGYSIATKPYGMTPPSLNPFGF